MIVHEVGVMQAAIEVALEHAGRHQARKVHRITLRVGPLAGVDPAALEFAFDVLVRGTMAEGAALHVERVPIVCYCPGCGREFTAEGWIFECPGCGKITDQVRQGAELEVSSVEVS
jgi:hydrogenase nickel incorporation protein HypA/HybF